MPHILELAYVRRAECARRIADERGLPMALLSSVRRSREAREITEHVLVCAATTDESIVAVLDEHFGRCRMTQKRQRARGSAISPGLEDPDEIADSRPGQSCVSGQSIQRRAQWADDVDGIRGRLFEAVQEADGETAFDDLPQIARRREMVVHAAVQNKKALSPRGLDIHDPRNIDTGFPYQIATRFDDEASPGECRSCPGFGHERADLVSQAVHVEFLLAREIRDTEAAPEVHRVQRATDPERDSFCDFETSSVLRDQYRMVEDLSAGEEMYPAEFDRGGGHQLVQNGLD